MNTRQALEPRTKTTSPKLLCAQFNQNQECFVIGHENGFRIYNTDPMATRFIRTFNKSKNVNSSKEHRSGIGHAAMLHRTNFIALVGGGQNPKFPVNKVVIYDDLKKNYTLCIECMSPVLDVFLSRIRIVIVLETQIFVHAFSSHSKLLSTFETISNPFGIADLATSISENNSQNIHEILAFPSRQAGQIQIIDISPLGQERNLVSIIKAHKSKIRCLTLNRNGTMIASASETGTIIRVHSVSNCSLLYEFRRGLDKAIIYSMKFSPDGSKLAVLSDKETLHVFRLDSKHDNNNNNSDNNRHHLLKSMPIFTNYFNSQWSFVSYHLNQSNPSNGASKKADKFTPDLNVNSKITDRGVIGWSGENSIIIIWKFRGKWEKFVIVRNDKADNNSVDNEPGWELVREGWKSFGDLDSA